MNKGELVDAVAEKATVTKKQADAVLSAALEAIMEAGGLVTGIDGEDTYMDSGSIVAGTPKIFPELLKTLQLK